MIIIYSFSTIYYRDKSIINRSDYVKLLSFLYPLMPTTTANLIHVDYSTRKLTLKFNFVKNEGNGVNVTTSYYSYAYDLSSI